MKYNVFFDEISRNNNYLLQIGKELVLFESFSCQNLKIKRPDSILSSSK
jgi:hypothetical protein